MEILKVEDLYKNFGGLQILQGISFSVKAGERLALIGPNGAGKTTLFNVLGGQLPASAGQDLSIRERDYNAGSREPSASRPGPLIPVEQPLLQSLAAG